MSEPSHPAISEAPTAQQLARELSALAVVSRSISSTLHFQPLLGLVLDQLLIAVPGQAVSLFLLDGDWLKVQAYRGPVAQEEALDTRILLTQGGIIRETIESRDPLIMADLHGNAELAREINDNVDAWGIRHRYAHARALLNVPLLAKDSLIGTIVLTHDTPSFFNSHHLNLAVAFASLAALAIYNAQLVQRAQALAIFEERQRLARELHDSVSQALYGISLGARTARTHLDRAPAQAAQPLDYVVSLAASALSEMRALIFELRPESLEREGLAAVLDNMATALTLRYKLNVTVDAGRFDESRLSTDEKYALQRIAQECFHNTVKHAHAANVHLRLVATERDLIMECSDDGRGFNATAEFPGHLGLVSMRERVEALFGSLVIGSSAGHGTRIVVRLPIF